MRSALVYRAKQQVSNHFELVRTVAVGARVYHNAGALRKQRLAETINEVFERVAETKHAKFVSQGDPISYPDFGSAPTEIDGVAGERGT